MSENTAHEHARHHLWVLLPALLAVVAIVGGFAISRERPVPLTINGVQTTVVEDTTIADLQREGLVAVRPGRLLAVDGSVLETEGGQPGRVLVNGRLATPETFVFREERIEGVNGADTVEATVAIREPIPVKTRITGSGPVMRLETPGAVGIRARVVGKLSNKVVSEKVVKPAQDMVVVRTRPHPSEKLIALTFDDGPWPGQTDRILKILDHEGVKATFFMLGVRVKQAPALARRVARDGHQVGNHSLGHRLLTKSKPKEIKRQIRGGADVIYKATGVLPTWFRPPYGAIDKAVWKQVRTARVHVALWTIDTRDWSKPGVKHIVNTATKNATRGSILLMHDGGVNRKQTIKALPKIIRKLKKRGFVFVTLDELAQAK